MFLWEPSLFPTRLPTLLLNGSSGIAVGMATKIPPHNLGELVDVLCALIHNPDATVTRLGFKLVAHYLIQTRRAPTHSKDSGAESLVSEEGELSSADEGSQPVTCNESVNADEHFHSNIIEVPILNECPNPHPDGYEEEVEEEEKQVHSSDGSSDEYEETDGDNTVNNDNKLKEKNEALMVLEVGDSKI